jgi:phosphoglycerol transferase MdoB-like AlkP superfamily enzyme
LKKFFLEFENLIARYRRLVVVFIAVILIQIFELTLLHIKYDVFTGGFLQPYSYKTVLQRLIFILVSLWFNLTLVGLLASLWFFVADKLNKYGLIIYYSFKVIVVFLAGIWLSLEFKLLSYFSDTLNLQIIKNLGGGSLREALLYVSNEILLFIGIIGIISVFLVFLSNFLKRLPLVQRFISKTTSHRTYLGLLAVCIALTPFITLYVSYNDSLRYGLEKETAYRLISASLDKLSDIDFDGYGSFSSPKDKAVLNTNIYPGALDIPNNGVDEDGFLGDAVITTVPNDSLAEMAPRPGKNIVLIVLESARADLLNQKINGEFVATVMREIAKNGVSIKHAYSHTGYTVTSINAIFNRDLVNSKDRISLIKFMQAAGYEVSIISGQDESFGNVAMDTGMKATGISYFDARTAIDDRVFPSKEQGSLRLSEDRVVEQFVTRINEVKFSKPQFFYINFQAAHFPYTHPKMSKRIIDNMIPRSEINEENKSWVAETYWNAIANADWAVGKIIDTLKAHNQLDKTTIVILGDHGESLFDDGFLGHGHAINDTQTQIPLIINDPTIIVDEPIGQSDVAEIAIRSALGMENKWINNDKTVFQFVGSLSQPSLIAHVGKDGVRTLFDFRSEEFYFSDLRSWKSYQKAISDPVYKDRAIKLIRQWEAFRWREHTVEK